MARKPDDDLPNALGCAVFLLAIIAIIMGGAFVLAVAVLLRHR